MLTRCPDCQTTFLITEQQLGAAAGKARCGRCGVVFDARAALLPQPEKDADAGPGKPSETTNTEAAVKSAPAAPAPAPSEPSDEPIPAVLLEDFEQAQNRRGSRRGWAWALAAVILGLTLVLQYAYFMRTQLVNQFPQARPWLVHMCSILSTVVTCEVPFATNLAKLRMLSSEVAEHPGVRDALLIQATFVNTASFTQRFPILEIKLSDLRGQPVALRRFRPAEYLRNGTDIEQGLAPRAPVTALIEVTRPFVDVNSYSFAFY